MVINWHGNIKGILHHFYSSHAQVQVTYFFGAENLLIGCQSHCLKIWRTPGGWENTQQAGNLKMLHPILGNKVVAIRNSASGSPRTRHPRLTSLSSWKRLLDW